MTKSKKGKRKKAVIEETPSPSEASSHSSEEEDNGEGSVEVTYSEDEDTAIITGTPVPIISTVPEISATPASSGSTSTTATPLHGVQTRVAPASTNPPTPINILLDPNNNNNVLESILTAVNGLSQRMSVMESRIGRLKFKKMIKSKSDKLSDQLAGTVNTQAQQNIPGSVFFSRSRTTADVNVATTTPTTTSLGTNGGQQLPAFISKTRANFPPITDESDRKVVRDTTIPSLKKNNNASLQEFLIAVDFYRLRYKPATEWDRPAIREIAAPLSDNFKPFVLQYLDRTDVTWDDFIIRFYDTFYDGNERAKENEALHGAKQAKTQKVIDYATWVKNKATRAHVEDQRTLGNIFFRGLLPEIIEAGKHNIPQEGFTLDQAVEFAVGAERTLNSIKTALDIRSGGQKSKKEPAKHTIAALPAPEYSSSTSSNKNKKKKKKKAKMEAEDKKPYVNEVKPDGTPNGILYLINDNGKSKLHPIVKNYRLTHTPPLCLRCGKPGHIAKDCQEPSRRITAKYTKVVPADFVINL